MGDTDSETSIGVALPGSGKWDEAGINTSN